MEGGAFENKIDEENVSRDNRNNQIKFLELGLLKVTTMAEREREKESNLMWWALLKKLYPKSLQHY